MHLSNQAIRTGRTIKCMSLSQRDQSAKAMHCTIPTMWLSGKGNTTETERDQQLPGLGEGGGGMGGHADFCVEKLVLDTAMGAAASAALDVVSSNVSTPAEQLWGVSNRGRYGRPHATLHFLLSFSINLKMLSKIPSTNFLNYSMR